MSELCFRVAMVFLWVSLSHASAASAEDDHSAHHPPNEPTSSAAMSVDSSSAAAPGQGMAGMMGKMMEEMGAPKPRDLYPSLMSLPDLPLEERNEIEARSHERMIAGAARMENALTKLSKAAKRQDFQAMQEAMPEVRQGVAEFDSGLAAHRALAEGRAPRRVALSWFKREMNLAESARSSVAAGDSSRVMHLAVIAILAIFVAVMIAMYFLKMRRAGELFRALSQPQSVASVQASPAAITERDTASPGDRVRSERQRIDATPVSPPPRFPTMKSASEPAQKWTGDLRVCRIFEEAEGVKTFRLAAADSLVLPFSYYPGQFLTIAAAIAGKIVRRSYTIASTPTQQHYVSITVKREELGLFSRHLHDEVVEGATLSVSAPNGKFTFTGTEAESIVLIAGGVGITPMMSVIRYLTDIGWRKDIYLLYCCRTTSDFIFRDELERLQERHSNLHVFASMTRAGGAIWMGLKGRFTAEIISHLVPEIEDRRIHLCGPGPMMIAVREMLESLGVPAAKVYTEAFGPTLHTVRTERAGVVPPEADARPQGSETRHLVRFTSSQKEGKIAARATILDAADELGVDIDNSCRSGQCGMCKVRVVTGQVTMSVEDALSAEEKSAGVVLACQAIPSADIEVDA